MLATDEVQRKGEWTKRNHGVSFAGGEGHAEGGSGEAGGEGERVQPQVGRPSM